jgi:hypothetical protein
MSQCHWVQFHSFDRAACPQWPQRTETGRLASGSSEIQRVAGPGKSTRSIPVRVHPIPDARWRNDCS